MPIRRKTKLVPIAHEDLVLRLADEIVLNRDDGPSDAPIIVEESSASTSNLSVTVVWDAWKTIRREDRGSIIINAYRRARGMDNFLPMWPPIGLAVGFTKEEASRLGIKVA